MNNQAGTAGVSLYGPRHLELGLPSSYTLYCVHIHLLNIYYMLGITEVSEA